VSAPGKGTAAPDLSGLAGVPAEMFLLASQVVVWGYPAVKFEQLMQVRTTEAILAMGNPRSAVNQLGLVRSLRAGVQANRHSEQRHPVRPVVL